MSWIFDKPCYEKLDMVGSNFNLLMEAHMELKIPNLNGKCGTKNITFIIIIIII